MTSAAEKSEVSTAILLVGGKDIGKTSLKKSLRKTFPKAVFLDMDEDGDDDDRHQYKTLMKSASVVIVAVGTYIGREDIWMIDAALDKNKECCLVRPKANVVTDTWCDRLYKKQWDELDEAQKQVVVKVVRFTHEDDKERIRTDFRCRDLPIFLVNGRTLATSQDLPVDYDAKKLLNYLKK